MAPPPKKKHNKKQNKRRTQGPPPRLTGTTGVETVAQQGRPREKKNKRRNTHTKKKIQLISRWLSLSLSLLARESSALFFGPTRWWLFGGPIRRAGRCSFFSSSSSSSSSSSFILRFLFLPFPTISPAAGGQRRRARPLSSTSSYFSRRAWPFN